MDEEKVKWGGPTNITRATSPQQVSKDKHPNKTYGKQTEKG